MVWLLTLSLRCSVLFFFFFNDTATTEIYTLSLHDALPIYIVSSALLLANILGGTGFKRIRHITHSPRDTGSSRANGIDTAK